MINETLLMDELPKLAKSLLPGLQEKFPELADATIVAVIVFMLRDPKRPGQVKPFPDLAASDLDTVYHDLCAEGCRAPEIIEKAIHLTTNVRKRRPDLFSTPSENHTKITRSTTKKFR